MKILNLIYFLTVSGSPIDESKTINEEAINAIPKSLASPKGSNKTIVVPNPPPINLPRKNVTLVPVALTSMGYTSPIQTPKYAKKEELTISNINIYNIG